MEQSAHRSPDGGRSRGWVHTHGPSLIELFRIGDVSAIALSLWCVCRWSGLPWAREGGLVALLAVSFFLLAAAHLRLYRSWRISPLAAELWRVFLCGAVTYLAVAAAVDALGFWPELPRMVLPAWAGLAIATIGAGRVVVRVGLRVARIHGRNFRTAAIVGANDTALRIAEQFASSPWMGIRILGIYDDTQDAPGMTVAGGLAALRARLHAGEVDTVYITLPVAVRPEIREMIRALRDSSTSVSFVADFSEFGLLSPSWELVGGLPTVTLVDNPQQGMHGLAKRVFDAVLSAAGLLLLALPLLAIAVAVKLTSPGPAVFAQRRHGLGGKEFLIYKFRTMTVTEDGKDAFTQARRGDARITPLGAFLRRTSLDELPQLVNVLRGQMSLVGPRPHPVALNEAQRSRIDDYMLRHKVKPGITGWAQVNGYRGETDTPEKMAGRVRYDLEYINKWSLWFDARILWLTLFRVFGDRNAH